MTRKLSRNYSLRVVAAFIAILTLLIAGTVLAQVTSADPPSGKATAVLAQSGASAPAQAERPLIPWTDGAGRFPVSRSHTKRHGTSPLDENPPLFVLAAIYDSGGPGASSLTVGDLNGDGHPDVVVTNTTSSSLGVLLANVDGTFQAAVSYDSGCCIPWSVAIRDVNGDGKPDLAVANFSGTVGVLLGKGDGTFQTAVGNNSGGYETFSVAIGDVNGDGHPDLAVASWCPSGNSCSNGVIGVLLGNGDGTFWAPVIYTSGGYQAYSVAIADVNGDGKPDLVAANNCLRQDDCSNGGVSVLLGNGDGTFQAPVSYSAGGSGTASVAIGDVNGDGHLDLVTANGCTGFDECENGVVSVLLGKGDGTFQAARSYSSGGAKAFSVAIGDVNGDGHPDLAVANVNTDSVGVLLGNGDGTFQPAVTFDSGGVGDHSVVVADVNGDAQPDLLVANCSGSFCGPGNGNGEGVVGVLLNNVFGLHISTVTTLLPSSPDPSVFGQAVMFTAQVTSDEGTPTGVVTLFDGSTAIGSAMLVNGTTSISVSSLAVGSRSISAKYEGSLKFSLSTSPPITQVVSTATTTTALEASPNPVPVRQEVTYLATVSSQYGGAVSGTVTFRDGGSTIKVEILGPKSNGIAGYITKYTSIGVHSITATYSGDANNTGSTSAPVTEYVAGASKTVVTTSGSPSYVGQPVTFTAKVTSKYGTIPDGELVTFYDGTTPLATVGLAGGTAAYTTSSLSAKTHTIKGTYVGDTTFLASTGKVTQLVLKYSTATALTSNLNPSHYGQAVTFTATVTPSGPYPPTGKVKFWDGTVGIGTATLSGGVAQLTTSKLAVGTHPITAQYLGDAASDKSTSPVVNQVVQ